MSATDALAKLQEDRSRAASRASALERDWRTANEETAQASEALADVERTRGNINTRRSAEKRLRTAKERAAEPWAERIEGARAATRDIDRRVREHTAANLDELVTAIEAKGLAAAARLNAAAADLLAAAAAWESAAAELGSTLARVSRPGPLDVSRPQAEQATRAVAALIAAGGEEGPMLARDREPWDRLLGLQEATAEQRAEIDELQAVTA
jgi:chromosome segregation ATPase